jgi:hypothetical protein
VPETRPYEANITHAKTNIYLCISGSAFILLWLAAMQYLPFFDSVMVFIFVITVYVGIERGTGKELLGLLRLVTVFVLALYGYPMLQELSDFNFGINDPLWVAVGWFLSLFIGSWLFLWVLCFLLDNPGANWVKSRFLDTLFATLLSATKGAVAIYVLVTVIFFTGAYCHLQPLGEQFLFSYTHRLAKIAHRQYPILDSFDKHNLLWRVQSWCDKIQIQRVEAHILLDNPSLQKKIVDFLQWLQQQPYRVLRLPLSPIAHKMVKELYQTPEAKQWLEQDEDNKRVHNESYLSLAQMCQLLIKPEAIELWGNSKIKEWASNLDFSQLQEEIEQKMK